MKTSQWLGVILALAAVLRLAWLGNVPAGFHNDEASFLTNAITLSAGGVDEDGAFLPIYLQSFIDPKPALYSYLQVPFVKVFGPSVFVARLPAVLLGILSIYLWFLILRHLFDKDLDRLLSAVVLSLSPWHIMLSRATQEAILGLVMMQFLVWLVLKMTFDPRTKNKFVRLLEYFGVLGFAFLAAYSYHAYKLLAPAAIGCLVWLRIKRLELRELMFLGLVGLGVGASLLLPGSMTRFEAINIFTRYAGFEAVYLMGTQYLEHFSPNFLILGLVEPTRYQVPNQGLIYLVELGLILTGIKFLFNQSRLKQNPLKLMIFWILISPLAASLTVIEVPSMIRSAWMVLPLSVLIAAGIDHFISNYSGWVKKTVLSVIILVYFIQFGWFLTQLFIHQGQTPSGLGISNDQIYRNDADMRAALAVKKFHSSYKDIWATNFNYQIYTYFVVAGIISPSDLELRSELRQNGFGWLGKTFISNQDCPGASLFPHTLYLMRANCLLPESVKVLTEISQWDGLPMYKLVTTN